MDFLVAPIARALGAARHAAIRPEVEGGRLTGWLLEPLCIDAGKLHWARVIADDLGVDLADSVFYGDDFGDLALLEAVRHPVVVNPDPRLRRQARARGWRIVIFGARAPRSVLTGPRSSAPRT